MHVIVSSPVSQIATSIAVSCSMVDLPCELEPSVQEFGSKLFRNPDAIGVFWSPGPASAAEHCRRFRLADIRNLLFALVEEGAGFELDGDGRVLVLGAGADEVQRWPIAAGEFVARLHALQRRVRRSESPFLHFGGCRYNRIAAQVLGPSGQISLTGQEQVLFETLTARPNIVFTKAMCLLAMHNGLNDALEKIVDVYIHKLRRKLAAICPQMQFIETVWGQGYRFVPDGIPLLIAVEGGAQ
ncbi:MULTISPECIES: response regulator transcription factor [Phyllobacteriaceae]|jgi:two-component system, cell cycle response regulator CtrA|uniref:response regulator transcription factor n=1 Tax=Phyllobacteriaceae TaxID=69277 RepID=UPI001378873A|nr:MULTISPECIES: response regulator transcription factor [Mesorhizobium]MBN9235149.1 response regulator transcription factor [Mesorhizobium sp.]